jgi:hypothetical protein
MIQYMDKIMMALMLLSAIAAVFLSFDGDLLFVG